MSSTQDARTYRTLDEQMEKLSPAEQRFERPESAARLLLQLGPRVEVLAPTELRVLMADAARGLGALYAGS